MWQMNCFPRGMFLPDGQIDSFVEEVNSVLYVALYLVHFAVNESESLEYLIF